MIAHTVHPYRCQQNQSDLMAHPDWALHHCRFYAYDLNNPADDPEPAFELVSYVVADTVENAERRGHYLADKHLQSHVTGLYRLVNGDDLPATKTHRDA